MKKYIKIVTSVMLVMGLFSCSDEKILGLTPINAVASDVAFTTPTLITASMNGMYNAASVGIYNNTANNPNSGRGYIWGAAFVQQGDNRGEDVINLAGFFQLTYTGTYDAGTANNVYYFVDGYRLINRCNLIIEGVTDAVSKNVITAQLGNSYIAEARFLRAITHFEMLNYFARPYNFTAGATHPGLPYREVGVDTDAEVESEKAQGRNTVAECYTKVLADLNFAESNLIGTNKFRATKEAAIAFKTRVFLQKRDWNNVILEGSKLSALSLAPTPAAAFTLGTNVETIFSIQHGATAGQNPGVNGALASMYKNRALICISPIIWRDVMWLNDDKRRENGVMTTINSGNVLTNKYTDITNSTDPAPVIRFAEVLLNMAEANARKTSPDLTSALTQLNRVRNRSLAVPATQAYTAASFATATDLVGAILKERRIEFICEGRRWSDIHRLQGDDLFPINGIPAKLANGNPPAGSFTLGTPYTGPRTNAAIPGSDFRFLWPIPLLVTTTNPILAGQQNPGW
ncbi:RagB/SusD family nutrient uptake outer membrane protein [Flavobacterium sp. LS2P90]|uniref:RagB/SusD family nutrient uptake outer membrane protein n=1 Tax=Flavobacterium xylosi TaxID=3230415 RepID=A0ABW6HZJ0_9FLAO